MTFGDWLVGWLVGAVKRTSHFSFQRKNTECLFTECGRNVFLILGENINIDGRQTSQAIII